MLNKDGNTEITFHIKRIIRSSFRRKNGSTHPCGWDVFVAEYCTDSNKFAQEVEDLYKDLADGIDPSKPAIFRNNNLYYDFKVFDPFLFRALVLLISTRPSNRFQMANPLLIRYWLAFWSRRAFTEV